MITFANICQLFGESKYIGYFLPIFFYVSINYFYRRVAELKRNQRQLTDITESIETDTVDNDNTDDQLRPHLPDRDHIPYKGLTEWLDKKGKRFFEIANNRRSIRKYAKNKPVDIDVIKNCVHAAGTLIFVLSAFEDLFQLNLIKWKRHLLGTSPSGAHTQPWTFCIIQDAQIKQEIRNIIEAEEYTNYTQRMSKQWTTDLQPLKTDFVKEYLTDAPCLILVFKQTYG